MERTRRSVVKSGLGMAAIGATAGCLGTLPAGDSAGDSRGYAAFFALADVGRNVGGDRFPFESPVDTGEMGHGWSPSGDVTREIAASELFFYLDSPEFGWAQDIASELERDYDDVRVFDGLEALESELIPFGGRGHGDEDDDDHDEDDHDDSSEGTSDFHDPHVWVDPVLVARLADGLGDELGRIDSEHADEYADNAEAYRERIADVDRAFEATVEAADRDVAVFAGHDSFRYAERRYGFELRTPVGVTPNAVESFDDISGLIDVIETHDVDTVLYDPFEAPDPDEGHPQMVDVIFEHTDVEDARPFSALSGTTAEWQENDWGWVEQMEEINLPSLRAALGA